MFLMGSNHRKLIAISVAVVIALGFATYVLWPPAQGVEGTLSRQDPPLPAGESQDS